MLIVGLMTVLAMIGLFRSNCAASLNRGIGRYPAVLVMVLCVGFIFRSVQKIRDRLTNRVMQFICNTQGNRVERFW